MGSLKILFGIVNTIFALTVIGLAACGIWYSIHLKDITDLRNYERIQLDNTIHWPQVMPWIFCVVGIIALLTVLCGFLSLKNQGLLVIYGIFLILAIIMLLGAGFAGAWISQTDNNKEFLKKTIWEVFNEAQESKYVTKKFQQLEISLHCCGADSFKNYLDLRKPIPESCCNMDDEKCLKNTKHNLRHGCIEVAGYYSSWAFIFFTVASGFAAVVGLVSLVLTVVQFLRQRKDEEGYEEVPVKGGQTI